MFIFILESAVDTTETGKSEIIAPATEVIYSTDVYQEGSIEAFLYDLYESVATGGFVLLVAGSAIMLRHCATSIGRVKFWMIVLLPLAYFLGNLSGHSRNLCSRI